MFLKNTRCLVALVFATSSVGCAASEGPSIDSEARAPAVEATATQEEPLRAAAEACGSPLSDVTRAPVVGDVAHYSIVLKVGPGPHDRLRLHRVVRESAPWTPRKTRDAIALQHGDFSSFATNFAPALAGATTLPRRSLAIFLAEEGLDVWGIDRRWTSADAATTDFSDFAGMGLAQAIADTGRALAFARAARAAQRASDGGRVFLGGFSRGAHIAYVYAGAESQRPASQRHVKGIVPIDAYARIAPEDEPLRLDACARRDYELEEIAAGRQAADNGGTIKIGSLAASAPDAPSPIFDGLTNRGAFLTVVGTTYQFFGAAPLYHLAGAAFSGETPVSLLHSPELVVQQWMAHAAPFQANLEQADSDGLWCGQGTLALDDHLRDIEVPIFYLGAAGGFGDHGLYANTLVRSRDVTNHVIRRLPRDQELSDYGHADLLFGDAARDLAWRPLAAWLLKH